MYLGTFLCPAELTPSFPHLGVQTDISLGAIQNQLFKQLLSSISILSSQEITLKAFIILSLHQQRSYTGCVRIIHLKETEITYFHSPEAEELAVCRLTNVHFIISTLQVFSNNSFQKLSPHRTSCPMGRKNMVLKRRNILKETVIVLIKFDVDLLTFMKTSSAQLSVSASHKHLADILKKNVSGMYIQSYRR